MKISTFATDLDLEEDGVWIDIGDGGSLLVARLGNPKYREYLRKASKGLRSSIRNKSISEELSDEILLKAMSETILLDWKGIDDDNGKPIKYTKETCLKLLTDLRDFRLLVTEIASEQQSFRREVTDKEGNS
jgi:hypothetical protein